MVRPALPHRLVYVFLFCRSASLIAFSRRWLAELNCPTEFEDKQHHELRRGRTSTRRKEQGRGTRWGEKGKELSGECRRVCIDNFLLRIAQGVFVIKSGKASFRPVKTGTTDNTHIIVTEGLTKGEEVVSGSYTAITSQLKEGSSVKQQQR